MSLIQRKTLLLVTLLALVAMGIGAYMSRPPVAFGEEPAGCNVSTVGISVLVTKNGESITVTRHGETLQYQVILSIPELSEGNIACNFEGGTLALVLPGGEERTVAGPLRGAIGKVSRGNPFESFTVDYTINQQHATADGDVVVTARYEGGKSLSVPEGLSPPEASGSVSNIIKIEGPAVEVVKTTSTPTIHQGQTANFVITVTNTGGLELSNVTITDADAPDCERTFPVIGVGESTEPYNCGAALERSTTNEVVVTADVIGGVPPDTQVQATDTADVVLVPVDVAVDVTPSVQVVRTGNQATVAINVVTPTITDLDDVTVTVVAKYSDGTDVDLNDCNRNFGTVGAAEQPPEYECTVLFPLGRNVVSAVATGTLPGTTSPLPAATASAEIRVIDPGLNIIATTDTEIIRGLPRVRRGESSPITITVLNAGDSLLTNVSVSNKSGFPEVHNCDRDLSDLGMLDSNREITIQCSSLPLDRESVFVFTVTAIAADNNSEGAESDSLVIGIIDPSTVIGMSEHDTIVMRFIVQTLTITETNDGDAPLTNVRVDLSSNGVVPLARGPLTRDSQEYVGGDLNNDGVLDPGESWEWRMVTVAVAGDVVLMSEEAQSMELIAIGFGLDELGGEITHPADVEELGTLSVPIIPR